MKSRKLKKLIALLLLTQIFCIGNLAIVEASNVIDMSEENTLSLKESEDYNEEEDYSDEEYSDEKDSSDSSGNLVGEIGGSIDASKANDILDGMKDTGISVSGEDTKTSSESLTPVKKLGSKIISLVLAAYPIWMGFQLVGDIIGSFLPSTSEKLKKIHLQSNNAQLLQGTESGRWKKWFLANIKELVIATTLLVLISSGLLFDLVFFLARMVNKYGVKLLEGVGDFLNGII